MHLLFYDYVPDILERRAPHRQEHLALVQEWHEAGRIVIAGAIGDPPKGALFVFTDAVDAEAFAARDPYGAAGLVTERRLEPWTVVTPLPT